MREFDDELREIRQEIVESRGLIIRTNNLVNTLSADLKSIAKRQHTYEKRLSWNSATAYVVFVIVVFAALKLAWNARVDAVRAETETRTVESDRLRKEAREFQRRDEERGRGELKAFAYAELIRQKKNVDVVEQFEAIKKEALSKTELALFTDAVERARNELAAREYQLGVERAKQQRWPEAAAALEESLRYKSDSSIAPSVRLALGEAYRRGGKPREAIRLLADLSESTAVDKEILDDALYQLAFSQTEAQEWNDAKTSWRALIRRFPDSHFVPEAKMQLAQLVLMH